MCGIMGFVGKSKNPKRTYELATSLLRETQMRGRDATGFYSVDQNGLIDSFKTDKTAQDFVKKTQAWKKRCPTAICLIGHARAKTHGTETKDINNHPHVSDDRQLALVHNGVISSYAHIARTNDLNLKGECDSEVLLRLIESENDTIKGIEKTFEETELGYSGMACFLSDIKNTDHPIFYAFRNSSNPILCADLRDELGQYFFFSTKYIWDSAVKRSGMNKSIKNVELIDVPSDEIWKIDSLNLSLEKIKIKTHTDYSRFYQRSSKKTENSFSNSKATTSKEESTESIEINNHFKAEYNEEVKSMLDMLDEIAIVTSKVRDAIEEHDPEKEKEIIDIEKVRQELDPILNSLEEMELNLPTIIDANIFKDEKSSNSENAAIYPYTHRDPIFDDEDDDVLNRYGFEEREYFPRRFHNLH